MFCCKKFVFDIESIELIEVIRNDAKVECCIKPWPPVDFLKQQRNPVEAENLIIFEEVNIHLN